MKKFTFKTMAACVMMVASLAFFRCSKNNSTTVTVPTLTTGAVTVTPGVAFAAMSGGSITSAGNGTLTAYGVCYSSTNQMPDLTCSTTIDGNTGTGAVNYYSTMTNLSPGTVYYVRAYATNSAGTAYGNLIQFTTSAYSWSSVFFTGNYNSISIKALSGICFSDDTHGFASGVDINNHLVLLTSGDGGNTWQANVAQSQNGAITLANNAAYLPSKNNSICFTSSSNGWIAYGGDSVFVTANGTGAGVLQPYPNNSAITAGEGLNSLYFTSSTTGFVAGLGIYKNTNGLWANVGPIGVYFNSVYFTAQGVGIASTNTSIYRSTDGGNTWALTGATQAPVYGFNYVNGVLYAAGSQSLLVSNDQGATWTSISTGISGNLYNICFINPNFGIAATQSGLYQVTNGGATWTVVSNTSGIAYNTVCRTSSHIFAISGASILKY